MSRVAPLRLRKYPIRATATEAAMMDTGLAWVFEAVPQAADAIEDRRAPERKAASCRKRRLTP